MISRRGGFRATEQADQHGENGEKRGSALVRAGDVQIREGKCVVLPRARLVGALNLRGGARALLGRPAFEEVSAPGESGGRREARERLGEKIAKLERYLDNAGENQQPREAAAKEIERLRRIQASGKEPAPLVLGGIFTLICRAHWRRPSWPRSTCSLLG